MNKVQGKRKGASLNVMVPLRTVSRNAKRMTTAAFCNAHYVMAAGALALFPTSAYAQEGTNIAQVSKTIFEQLDDLGTLVIGAAFLVGIVLVAAGLMKFKQAADTQGQQAKYSDGLWRLVIGVGLVSLLWFTDIGVNTFGGSADQELSGGGGVSLGGGGS